MALTREETIGELGAMANWLELESKNLRERRASKSISRETLNFLAGEKLKEAEALRRAIELLEEMEPKVSTSEAHYFEHKEPGCGECARGKAEAAKK